MNCVKYIDLEIDNGVGNAIYKHILKTLLKNRVLNPEYP